MQQIQHLFEVIDNDKSGEIDVSELREALDDREVAGLFNEIGISKMDADELFDLFDTDGNSMISLAEFVDGCLRMTGPAKAKHMLSLQYDMSKLKSMVVGLAGTMEALQKTTNCLCAQSASGSLSPFPLA